MIVISILMIFAAIAWLVFFLWLRPLLTEPLDEPLDLPTEESVDTSDLDNEIDEEEDKAPPICGDLDELTLLVIGSDYRQGGV